MLAIHWTPVNKTKHILKAGITPSWNGLYCFPLTGDKVLDKWWVSCFNRGGKICRKKYNGLVFRIKEEDLPAYFGYFFSSTVHDTFDKPIKTLKELESEYRNYLLFVLGMKITNYADNVDYVEVANKAIEENKDLSSFIISDLDTKYSALDDYQIVLSHSIKPNRIINVIPQGDEFGKHLRRKKKEKIRDNEFRRELQDY